MNGGVERPFIKCLCALNSFRKRTVGDDKLLLPEMREKGNEGKGK